MDAEDPRTIDPTSIHERLGELPVVRVMDVDYVHVPLPRGDDLYLTRHGRPLAPVLLPENYWADRAWFRGHHERLSGSSTLYRIRTKCVAGQAIDIVLKWNRMGQDVPGATRADDLATAEFNSPFEEFSLAIELRDAAHESPGRLLTHKPLAIYVPREHVDLDRLGRRQHVIQAKQQLHTEITLHIHRNYAVIYEWVKGIDAVEAFRKGLLSMPEMAGLARLVADEVKRKGFVVRDNKAEHVIVRPKPTGRLARDRQGEVLHALVDFELLERTPERDRTVRALKRRAYLLRQARRFEPGRAYPPHLRAASVFDVEYVYGHIESTGGALWVVGKDPELFDYFLPEKWRKTPRTKLSAANPVYETTTKDSVHLVWRVSRVGERPVVEPLAADPVPFRPDEEQIAAFGYNSPFEEVALAMAIGGRGLPTIYPRAIYMTSEAPQRPDAVADRSRYDTHSHLLAPDGWPVLRDDRDYIIIWGFWNAPDELLAVRDMPLYKGLNALSAYRRDLLDEPTYLRLMAATRQDLEAIGIEDLNFRGSHVLLSLDRNDRLVMAPGGLPQRRICNFELLKSTTGSHTA